jgi:hypothetical protein
VLAVAVVIIVAMSNEPVTRVRSVFAMEACIFCGSPNVTKEHLLPEWVPRAFQRSRRPRINVMRQSDAGRNETQYGPQQLAAKVSCRECNNGWMAQLDNRASQLIKPLVQGRRDVHLDPPARRELAAWALKTVVVNDLPITAGKSVLLPYAPALRTALAPPTFIQVWAGPPIAVFDGDFRIFGVLPNHGVVQLGTGPAAKHITAHVWRLMLGYTDLIIRPLFQWIPLPDPEGCLLIFPSSQHAVTLSPSDEPQASLTWSGLPPGMVIEQP